MVIWNDSSCRNSNLTMRNWKPRIGISRNEREQLLQNGRSWTEKVKEKRPKLKWQRNYWRQLSTEMYSLHDTISNEEEITALIDIKHTFSYCTLPFRIPRSNVFDTCQLYHVWGVSFVIWRVSYFAPLSSKAHIFVCSP